MQNERTLGTFFGLRFSIIPLFFVGTLIIFAVMSIIGLAVLKLHTADALIFALLCTLVHWLDDLVHSAGHAIAARSTGYPMVGLRLGTLGVFGTTLYPDNEPALPGSTHIQRAVGGPALSLSVAIVLGLIAYLRRADAADISYMVLVFAVVELVAVFGPGAFIPLPFTDGDTLRKWWGKQ